MPFSRKPPLTVSMIFGWIDAHKKRTGAWPHMHAGPVRDGYLGDNWRKIDNALRYGPRGLPGGDSLAKLLVEARDVRSPHYLPDLTEEAILIWADRHHASTGVWPIDQSGTVPGEKGEGWHNIDAELRQGAARSARRVEPGPTATTARAGRPIGSLCPGWPLS
jgi:hypothetical protein